MRKVTMSIKEPKFDSFRLLSSFKMVLLSSVFDVSVEVSEFLDDAFGVCEDVFETSEEDLVVSVLSLRAIAP